jgi:hypothetical protein
MSVEESLKECEYNINQIQHHNPNPYYVSYFLKEFIQSTIGVYDGIIQEANRDFGLFVSGKCTPKKFEKKAKEKNDKYALRFSSWFDENYKNEHKAPYPEFINKVISFFEVNNEIPETTIKILASERYKDDIVQKLDIICHKGKLRSEEMQIEIRRQMPLFLQVINQKRKNNDEPAASEKQVIASTFLEIENFESIEIPYACSIYFPVLKRIIKNSREQIQQLYKWTG